VHWNPNLISERRRNSWAAVKVPANYDQWNGRRLLWFEGDRVHVDGLVYADYRGMPPSTSPAEIEEDADRFLGAKVVWEKNLIDSG